MDAIVGGIERSGGTTDAAGSAATLEPTRPRTSEERLHEGLLRCMGRWGLAKTTIEDIAREAGMSRASVYRLCPGGKNEILEAAARSEVQRLVEVLESVVATAPDLDTCMVELVHRCSTFLEQHEALRFVREHEPVIFEHFLGFERVEALFDTAGELLSPSLQRFFEPADARRVGVWLARVVLSYVQTPSAELDLTDRDDARRLVRTFLMAGMPDARGSATPTRRPDHTDTATPTPHREPLQ